MQQKKKNFLEKIVKKNYNNELEKILEEKQFDENTRSTLLSILYKIETSYKDLEIVKKDVETKEEYIDNLLNIIKNKCNIIKIIKINDEQSKIPKNKTYIIDKEKKEIIAYPIERKILYAISKIDKKDKIIKDEYFLIDKTLSNLINVGNSINMVEPIRDFNGYSWSTIIQEIESIEHNLIYQNLRILVGNKFLNKWIKNNEFIIDYFELFKENLKNRYGLTNREKFIDILSKISILLYIKYDKQAFNEINAKKEKVENELQEIENKEQFIEKTTAKKSELINKIKDIDTIINDKDLLQNEYTIRNERLPIEKKIFSMKILSKMMEKERTKFVEKLEQLNKIMNPQNFVKYKKELEEKYEYLKIVDIEDKDAEIEKLLIQMQKVFLNMVKSITNKVETKQEIQKIIYDFRYYMLLPYNHQKLIKDIKELEKTIKEVSELIINKAIDLKLIEKVSNDNKTNYEILKNIFDIRIVKLEDAYLKITKEKNKKEENYFVQIFDENIFEEKIKISKPKDLEIKLNGQKGRPFLTTHIN